RFRLLRSNSWAAVSILLPRGTASRHATAKASSLNLRLYRRPERDAYDNSTRINTESFERSHQRLRPGKVHRSLGVGDTASDSRK
ncbi:MAG TPA: hypothetical protein VHZ09_06010, partial [Acidobacteriaceae bacterium]|nr:hypothetical protein [Acidobacteriaceae bacterium]